MNLARSFALATSLLALCASAIPHAACSRRTAASGAAVTSATRRPFVVHCDAPTHPISPLVYGIGLRPGRDDPAQWELGATARRWGGNHTSRYNWRHGNAWNTGKDWYFENVGDDAATAPAYRRFLDDADAHGLATALTVPTIGWVAKDTRSRGFPVAAFGREHAVAPDDANAGDGYDPSGAPLTPGDPRRTSTAMPPEGIGDWVRTVAAQDASVGAGIARTYILDNEPTLWNETHRDVHPLPVSYDELLARSVSYAREIRRADPGAIIAGPAAWGWPAYFDSAEGHGDRAAHGGEPILAWWLRKMREEERRSGTKLVDLLDVHFYPQGHGIGVGTEGEIDEDTAARRIRSTRALWDPSYVDESWIGEPVKLVPRLEEWIDANAPGVGVSIGEYNFGAESHMSGGLAVAEALGRFGTLGVRSAYYFDYPPAKSPAFWAFRAFRDFDGAGGRFLDESVPAVRAGPATSVFASRDPARRRLVVVLLNFDPSAASTAEIDASSCGTVASRRTLVYAGGDAGFVPSPGSELPPHSMAIAELTLAAPTEVGR